MRKDNAGSKFMLVMLVWNIIFILSLIVSLEVLQEISGFDSGVLLSSPWFQIFYQLTVFMLPLAIWTLIRREPLKPSLPAQKLGSKNIIIIVALGFLLQPMMMMISGISALFFNNDVAAIMYTFQQQPFLLTLITVAVTPAVCEELVFRGYIQSKYRECTIRKAALINGLFFAIMHLNLQQFAYTFVLGIIFAYMVHHTRSIWAAIIPHFIVNATQATMARLVLAAGTPQYPDLAAEELLAALPVSQEALAIIVMGIIALFLSPVIVILFMEFFKHNRERNAEMDYEASLLPTDQPTPTYVPGREQASIIDPYTIAVIALFILFIALTIAS